MYMYFPVHRQTYSYKTTILPRCTCMYGHTHVHIFHSSHGTLFIYSHMYFPVRREKYSYKTTILPRCTCMYVHIHVHISLCSKRIVFIYNHCPYIHMLCLVCMGLFLAHMYIHSCVCVCVCVCYEIFHAAVRNTCIQIHTYI